jgi:hypothetical protein
MIMMPLLMIPCACVKLSLLDGNFVLDVVIVNDNTNINNSMYMECGVKNIFGILVHSKQDIFPMLYTTDYTDASILHYNT